MIDTRALTQDQKASLAKHAKTLASAAMKPGDRFRATKCPGTKRWATFAGFDGGWIVSKSGIDDYSPLCVDMIERAGETRQHVDFSAGWRP